VQPALDEFGGLSLTIDDFIRTVSFQGEEDLSERGARPEIRQLLNGGFEMSPPHSGGTRNITVDEYRDLAEYYNNRRVVFKDLTNIVAPGNSIRWGIMPARLS
jgi:hypothetical protein